MNNQTQNTGPREIAPFNPAANGPEQPIDEMAIAVDELENLTFAASSLLMEKNDNTPELRSALSVLGAMQLHLITLKKHCTQ